MAKELLYHVLGELMNLKTILFYTVFLMSQISQAYYLFAEKDISVRATSSRRSKEIHTIKAGETFEVIKWNNYNTRIRLSDGTIGFIDKTHVAAYAPPGNDGYLVRPLKLTTTPNKNDMYSQRPSISLDYQPQGLTSNAENPDGSDLVEEDNVNDANDIVDYDQQTDDYKEEATYSNSALLANLANETWHQATRKRARAKFLGGGTASGNRSKGMCAQAVKEALTGAGVCTSYPSGNAAQTHTSGSLKRSCPKLKLAKQASSRNKLDITDISKAPAGSVIVYNGYAGRRPHDYGHIEIKVPVTPELRAKMGRDGLSVKVGDFVYCSDFCRATPTKKSTNEVIAIYTL
jgi:hypothetical protein